MDGQEQEVGAGVAGSGELDVEVGGGGVGEGAFIDNGNALVGGFLHKGVTDALGISVVVAVDDGDLCAGEVVGKVVSGGNALVGVGEADLEGIVLVSDEVDGGAGRGEQEGALVIGLGSDRDAGAGGDRSEQDLHAPVHQGVVGVDGLVAGVGFIVLRLELKLDGAVRGVDLVNGDLGCVHNGIAVDGGAAGQGALSADLEGAVGEGGGSSQREDERERKNEYK